MDIVLTYNPRWEYTPEDRTPFWASLNTVDYVVKLLEETDIKVLLVETDSTFEHRLRAIKSRYSEPLMFWLNEFMPSGSGKDVFTVSVIEKVGMMHTGPGSEALGIGLDKEATKEVLRHLGLPTPDSYVVYVDDYSPINQHDYFLENRRPYKITTFRRRGDVIDISAIRQILLRLGIKLIKLNF